MTEQTIFLDSGVKVIVRRPDDLSEQERERRYSIIRDAVVQMAKAKEKADSQRAGRTDNGEIANV